MKYKALLIDFDDTIIGTENSNFFLFKESMEGLIGRELTREDGAKFAGHTWKGIFQILSDEYLPDMSPEAIRKIFVDAKTEYFRERTAPVAKGLSELLELDIRKAIVTGSSRPEVDMFAGVIPLDKFDLIATDELYENGKPAPDAYLYACKALNLTPENCLAVEDSVIGLTSARKAGCATVFTKEFAHDDHSGIADYTVSDMTEILKLLQVTNGNA